MNDFITSVLYTRDDDKVVLLSTSVLTADEGYYHFLLKRVVDKHNVLFSMYVLNIKESSESKA